MRVVLGQSPHGATELWVFQIIRRDWLPVAIGRNNLCPSVPVGIQGPAECLDVARRVFSLVPYAHLRRPQR